MLPNLGTTGSQLEEHRFSVLGTSDSKSWNQSFPIMEPRVSSSNRWWSAKVVTNASQSWNHGFPARGTAGFPSIRTNASQPWNHGFPVLGTSHSKSWNQSFPILEPRVPSSNNWWWSAKVVTNASQSWNHGFPARGTAGSQSFEPMLPNLGTTGSQFEERAVPKRWNLYISFPILFPSVRTNASQSWNLCFPILEPRVPSSRNWRPKCWNQCSPSLGLCVSSPRNCRLFPSLEPWIPSSRNRLLDLQELYTFFQGWKLCFAAWHVFNFQELRPACVCAKQGVYWTDMHIKKLDDGWPESVEEQSLLVLVWKHYIRRQYIKDVK